MCLLQVSFSDEEDVEKNTWNRLDGISRALSRGTGERWQSPRSELLQERPKVSAGLIDEVFLTLRSYSKKVRESSCLLP